MNISLSYPYWFLFFCFFLGAGYATALYYKDKTFAAQKSSRNYLLWLLSAFRFLSVSILSILLLSPFIRIRSTQTNKPIIAVLQDNSESIRNSFTKNDSANYFKKLNELTEKLKEKYEVVPYSFGDELKKKNEFDLKSKVSNLSAAIENVNDIFYNQNLGAVVLASDGIYNQGINPVYAAAKVPYSIYTIALGDTTIPKDLKFENAFYNKIAYLNDQFGLRVDISATNLSSKQATLTIVEILEGKVKPIASKAVSIAASNFFQTYDFILPADKVGIAHYQLSLTNLNGEVTYKNNVKDIFVEVLDGRQKILLIANSPHPDIAALKQTIEANKNYQLDVMYADDFAAKLNDYNLIILHQLPSLSNKIANILTQAHDLKKSLLFVVGSQTSTADLVKSENALVISGNANRFNEVTAKVNKDFSGFTLSDATMLSIAQFPPLSNFFGDYKRNPTSQVLLNQKINSVETDFPLWLFADAMDSRVGIIAGEGIWRWRLYDYLQHKNHDAFNELLNKTIQYLAVKSDKRPFRVNLPKSIFQDNEAVNFDAQLYNANFELVNSPDVDVKIKSEDGKDYPFKFSKTEKYYTLNAGFLPVGGYSYSATTKLGNTTYRADGKFSIAPLQLEEMRTVADHNLLYQLASQHNGKLYHSNDFEKIAEDINATNKLKPILFDTYKTESAINLKWIFVVLLLLVSGEWFTRKYLGGY